MNTSPEVVRKDAAPPPSLGATVVSTRTSRIALAKGGAVSAGPTRTHHPGRRADSRNARWRFSSLLDQILPLRVFGFRASLYSIVSIFQRISRAKTSFSASLHDDRRPMALLYPLKRRLEANHIIVPAAVAMETRRAFRFSNLVSMFRKGVARAVVWGMRGSLHMRVVAMRPR
jgi:hypothetical protein